MTERAEFWVKSGWKIVRVKMKTRTFYPDKLLADKTSSCNNFDAIENSKRKQGKNTAKCRIAENIHAAEPNA